MFNRVISTIIVPTPRLPPGASSGTTYSGSAWVGIDGYGSCSGAILQTGIDSTVSGNGAISYRAWYEWYPAPSFSFDRDIAIRAGDKLRFTVGAASSTTGIALVENLSTGQSVLQALSSSVALCGTDAEWIVEDYTINGKLVPFANFGSVTFSDARVSGPSGVYGPGNVTLIDLYQGSHRLTQAFYSQSDVIVNYIG